MGVEERIYSVPVLGGLLERLIKFLRSLSSNQGEDGKGPSIFDVFEDMSRSIVDLNETNKKILANALDLPNDLKSVFETFYKDNTSFSVNVRQIDSESLKAFNSLSEDIKNYPSSTVKKNGKLAYLGLVEATKNIRGVFENSDLGLEFLRNVGRSILPKAEDFDAVSSEWVSRSEDWLKNMDFFREHSPIVHALSYLYGYVSQVLEQVYNHVDFNDGVFKYRGEVASDNVGSLVGRRVLNLQSLGVSLNDFESYKGFMFSIGMPLEVLFDLKGTEWEAYSNKKEDIFRVRKFLLNYFFGNKAKSGKLDEESQEISLEDDVYNKIFEAINYNVGSLAVIKQISDNQIKLLEKYQKQLNEKKEIIVDKNIDMDFKKNLSSANTYYEGFKQKINLDALNSFLENSKKSYDEGIKMLQKDSINTSFFQLLEKVILENNLIISIIKKQIEKSQEIVVVPLNKLSKDTQEIQTQALKFEPDFRKNTVSIKKVVE